MNTLLNKKREKMSKTSEVDKKMKLCKYCFKKHHDDYICNAYAEYISKSEANFSDRMRITNE